MRLTDKVLRAIRWDTATTLIVSAISFVTTVWLVRLLGPQRYGMLASLLALLGLLQLVASGGARYLLLRFVPEVAQTEGLGAVGRLLRGAAVSRTCFLLIVSLPLVLAPDRVAEVLLGRAELAKYLRWLPLLLAPPLYADLLGSTLIALFHQPTVRLGDLFNKTVFALFLLAVPMWGDPLYGLFTAWIAGWIAGIVFMVIDTRSKQLVPWPRGECGRELNRWLRFSGAAYGLSLIGYVLGRELDILLLTRLGIDNEILAQYAVCFAFVSLVFRVPVIPIAGGFGVPLIAGLYTRKDWSGLRRLFRAYFEYIYVFILPLVGGGLLIGPSLLAEIYGERYGRAVDIYYPLLILLGVTKLGGITGPFLLAADREGVSLRVRLTMSVVNVLGALVAIPLYGAAGAAWATGASMLGMVIWEAVVLQRFLQPRYPWDFLFRTLLATVWMMAFVWIARMWVGPRPGLLALLTVIVVGGVAYLCALLWLRPISAEYGKWTEGSRIPGMATLVRHLTAESKGQHAGV